MALDVRYLRGTQAQYESYIENNKIVDTYYYLIFPNKVDGVFTGTPSLYIGKVRLDNVAFDDSQIWEAINDLKDDVDYLKENAGHKFYEVTELPAFVEGHPYKEGDVCIVTITENGINYKTAYHCIKNAEESLAWAAMAGNYNAENVYFDENLVTTYAMGNISLTNGQGTVASAGKNLKEVWNAIYQKETAPTITSATVTAFSAGPDNEVEIGTKISSITYSGTFREGSYSFGSVDAENNSTVYTDTSSGIGNAEWTVNYSLKDSGNGEAGDVTEASTNSGSFALKTPFQVNTTTSKIYANITYKAEWDQSPRIPINNLGAQVSGRIDSGSKEGNDDVKIQGFRKMFYGTFTEKKASLTSADFRDTSTIKGEKAAKKTFDLSIPAKTARVVIALPSGYSLTKALDVNDSNSDLFAANAFKTDMSVNIDGAEGFTPAAYSVYYIDYAKPDEIVANTYKVTIG